MPFHKVILAEIKKLNDSFLPILECMVCYRSEIGLMLQRLVESYNMILLDQFESYYKNKNKKEAELKEREQMIER